LGAGAIFRLRLLVDLGLGLLLDLFLDLLDLVFGRGVRLHLFGAGRKLLLLVLGRHHARREIDHDRGGGRRVVGLVPMQDRGGDAAMRQQDRGGAEPPARPRAVADTGHGVFSRPTSAIFR
jgi:hypothetical protein